MLAVGSRINNNANSNNNQYHAAKAARQAAIIQDVNAQSGRTQARMPNEATASINQTNPKWPFAAKKIKIKNRQQVGVGRPIVQRKPDEPATKTKKSSHDFDAIED